MKSDVRMKNFLLGSLLNVHFKIQQHQTDFCTLTAESGSLKAGMAYERSKTT